jgi:GIY-YIG catalytic domain
LADRQPPAEVAKIRKQLKGFWQEKDAQGRHIGSAKCGVYLFYDYEGEPIYVGQTRESLSGRIGRHLTGRRSDAVAQFVLDPFEVLDIEVWPMFDAEQLPKTAQKAAVNAAEYAVYRRAIKGSRFGAVLNEKPVAKEPTLRLPPRFRGRIIPDDLYVDRKHPDVRIARRAQTVASLARLIAERKVGKGLRTTLFVQAQRLEALTTARLIDFADQQLEANKGNE